MNFAILLTDTLSTMEAAASAADTVAQTNNYLGAFITVICCIITCTVTWKVTLLSIEKKKFTYQTHLFPLLSKVEGVNIADMKMEYKEETLKNPCFLTVDIMNTGNKSVENPSITIGYDENIRIIPAYLEDVPRGYEKDWKLTQDQGENNKCKISLNHLNAKNTVKARFFLDNYPNGRVYVTCPMSDLEVIEGSLSRLSENLNKNPSWRKLNMYLTGFTCFLIYSYLASGGEYWLKYFLSFTDWHLRTFHVYIYLIGVILLSQGMNWFGKSWLDRVREQFGVKAFIIEIILIILSIFGIYAMLYDKVIYGIQVIFAIIIIILHSFLIHRFWIILFTIANR